MEDAMFLTPDELNSIQGLMRYLSQSVKHISVTVKVFDSGDEPAGVIRFAESGEYGYFPKGDL